MDTTFEKTKAVVEGLNAIGKNTYTHEYLDTVFVQDTADTFVFGHSNETWGASVTDVEGRDLAYLETNLVFADESVARIVYETQRAVDAYFDIEGHD